MPHVAVSRPIGAENAIVQEIPRTVVAVKAFDARGNHLTITQPQGAVFLSPVLMMQHEQTISGLRVPFDSFNVPAAQRVVKALLFSPAEAAVMFTELLRIKAPYFSPSMTKAIGRYHTGSCWGPTDKRCRAAD